MTLEIPRRQYVSNYGPTVGDRVRLADTEVNYPAPTAKRYGAGFQ